MNTRMTHSSTGKQRPSPPHSSGNLSSHKVKCEDVTALNPPASSPLGVATPYTLNWQSPLTPLGPPPGGKRKLEPADEHGQAERSKKHVFSGATLAFLEARFAEEMYPSAEDREKMAKELGLDGSRVYNWFHNKRAKEKQKNPSGLQMPPTPQDDDATLLTEEDKSAAQSPTYIAPASVRRMACRHLRIGTWESEDVIVARSPDTQTINYSIAGTESWLMIQYPMSAIRETRMFRNWGNGLPSGVGIYLNEAPKFFSSTLRFGVELTPRDDFTGGQASSNLLHILSDSGVAAALTTSPPSLSPARPIPWPPNQSLPGVTTRQPGQWFNGVNSTYNQAFGSPVHSNLRGQNVWAGDPGAAIGSSLPTMTPWYETQRPADVPMQMNAQPMQMNAPMQYENRWPVWPATTVNHYPESPLGPQEVAGGSSTTPMGSHAPYYATPEDAHRETIQDPYNAAQPDVRANKVGPTLEDALEASNEVAEAPDDEDDPSFVPGLKYA
ncbi:hypothetical protein Z517_09410 [Fonsecaea pedrosoi CBS 271.37]|uniref:Homeobox domain-containing protein n=1 Tax=Fonsecaea pedrosoi CBS 271.37 TaxID=1442368 RepID=A0A0D2DH19_9EURO|nr:uncharacterized protein Z517_09410 [Fonsecaea pedrosoi CBS 271.37]KIW76966.1 hypothetical protein Z517_09410 [Fonsecaea pedrosoi CBS 271.37]